MKHNFSLILDLAVQKSKRSRGSVNEALEDLAFFDPETELGKQMTTAMVKVNEANLLDTYMGYTRESNKIQLIFAKEATNHRIEALTKLLQEFIDAGNEDISPLLNVEYFKQPDPDDENEFTWIVQFACSCPIPEEDDEHIPQAVDLQGDISTEKEPEVSDADRGEPNEK